MFGKNTIEGQRYFRDAADDSIMRTSTFLTLQGEGPFMGRPAMFVRLSKCNLACEFCDTYFDHGDWLTHDELMLEIMRKIRERYRRNPPHIGCVVTGGEPMLQRSITKLCTHLVHNFEWVQIETNGILYQELPKQVCLVVSPKIMNEKHQGYARPHKRVLERADCFKFVVSADPSSPYHRLPDWLEHERRGRPVYISPMNVYRRRPAMVAALEEKREPSIDERNAAEAVSFWDAGLLDMEANRKNHEYAFKYALDNLYHLSLQMHLYVGAP